MQILVETRSSLAVLSRILAKSCVTSPYIFRQRVTHDCASVIDSIAKKSSYSHFFYMVHSRMILTLVYNIHPYTCICMMPILDSHAPACMLSSSVFLAAKWPLEGL